MVYVSYEGRVDKLELSKWHGTNTLCHEVPS